MNRPQPGHNYRKGGTDATGISGNSRPRKYAVGRVKKRIRDIERLLRKQDIKNADARVELERELVTCKHELERNESGKKRQKMIAKYHKVRFFDRQRATRRLKRLKKKRWGDLSPGELSKLDEEVYEAEVDLNYTLYYPLEERYSSLFPRAKGDNHAGDGATGLAQDGSDEVPGRVRNERMRLLVKNAMNNSTLEDLRNGKLTSYSAPENANSRRRSNAETSHLHKSGRPSSTAHSQGSMERRATGGSFSKAELGLADHGDGKMEDVDILDENDDDDDGFFE
ncbi:hypothetical protein BDY21DRAFT_365173 [Lineolata rhizophorae]|uniref:rRNA-processing protein EFG1 n=1 Tax=Lineolata rhizophorae TaxID=578093 RepID=A0A6A6NW66_9PEZI|nr:hypothetical protein BDY21DRAFT_365173 [Lineolata rhizophorae]